VGGRTEGGGDGGTDVGWMSVGVTFIRGTDRRPIRRGETRKGDHHHQE
jgi:hypothetical protein